MTVIAQDDHLTAGAWAACEGTNAKANAKQNSGQKLGTRNTVSFFATARHCPEQNSLKNLNKKKLPSRKTC